jgi:hypothetical protein
VLILQAVSSGLLLTLLREGLYECSRGDFPAGSPHVFGVRSWNLPRSSR